MEQYTAKLMSYALAFFYNISLKEEGYDIFNSSGMELLERMLSNLQSATREMTNALCNAVMKYISKIDRAFPQIVKIINEVCQKFKLEVV